MNVYEATFRVKDGSIAFRWRGLADDATDAEGAATTDMEVAFAALQVGSYRTGRFPDGVGKPKVAQGARKTPSGADATPRWIIGAPMTDAFGEHDKQVRSGFLRTSPHVVVTRAIADHVFAALPAAERGKEYLAWVDINRRSLPSGATIEIDRTAFQRGPGQWPDPDPLKRELIRAAFAMGAIHIGEYGPRYESALVIGTSAPQSATLAAAKLSDASSIWLQDRPLAWLDGIGLGAVADGLRAMAPGAQDGPGGVGP